MNKPQDYDQVQEYGNIPQLPPGGYICRIMKVEETTAQSSGAPMLKIGLEIAEGEHKGHFMTVFNSDTRSEKKWPCVVNQLVYDNNGGNTTNRGFKTFITAVEKSNSGFAVQWGNGFAACFKNKLVGGLFRREQFIGNDGKAHFSTKCFQFRSADAIHQGVSVPEDKLLDSGSQTYSGYPSAASASVRIDYSEPVSAPVTAPVSAAAEVGSLSDFEEIITESDLPF